MHACFYPICSVAPQARPLQLLELAHHYYPPAAESTIKQHGDQGHRSSPSVPSCLCPRRRLPVPLHLRCNRVPVAVLHLRAFVRRTRINHDVVPQTWCIFFICCLPSVMHVTLESHPKEPFVTHAHVFVQRGSPAKSVTTTETTAKSPASSPSHIPTVSLRSARPSSPPKQPKRRLSPAHNRIVKPAAHPSNQISLRTSPSATASSTSPRGSQVGQSTVRMTRNPPSHVGTCNTPKGTSFHAR